MIELTDEILNRYIDGELQPAEIEVVKQALKTSEDAKRRLSAMQLVHSELKKYPVKNTSHDFTSLLMKKIVHRREPKKQKYFIFSVSSVFVLLSLAIIGYLTSFILTNVNKSSGTNNSLNNLVYLIEKLVVGIKSLFTTGSISVIGFILSFIIIISAWLFFDSHRQTKAKFTKP